MTKQIQLTQGKVALVDDEDFERISEYKWYASKVRNTGRFYASRAVVINSKSISILMHREIMRAPDGIEVDHVRSEDTLDNRHSNLRLCTHTQNQFNRGKNANNTSGFKGVCRDLRSNKWRARIQVDGQDIHLGYHDTAEAAAHSYDMKAKELRGEFARLNFDWRQR